MKIAFLCIGNSCRSQIAEALAKSIALDDKVEFYSAGTNPEKEVNKNAIKILSQYNIKWKGYPKTIDKIPKPDIVVTMGCGVDCPVIPGAKVIDWEIPDPIGKNISEYYKITKLIHSELIKLFKKLNINYKELT